MVLSESSIEDAYCRMRPSPAKAIACFYCGNGMPWFQCHCFRALEAQTGKRQKPRVITAEGSPNGRTIIVLDEEALASGWLRLPRYEKSVTTVTEVSVTPVTKSPLIGVGVTESVTELVPVTGSVTKSPMSDAERARLYRQRRAAEQRGEG